jgi:tetratricopeptide (TPR) repeat protein
MARWSIALALVIAAALGLVLLKVWRRGPYDHLKPHEALKAGDEALLAGDYARALDLYLVGARKGEKAGFNEVSIRPFHQRLAEVHALRDDLAAAEPFYRRAIEKSAESFQKYSMWDRLAVVAAHNLAVLHQRRGRFAEAQRLLDETSANWLGVYWRDNRTAERDFWTGEFWRGWLDSDKHVVQMVILVHLDAAHFAQGHEREARVAVEHLVRLLEMLSPYSRSKTIPRGFDAYLLRHASRLRGQGRTSEAAAIEGHLSRVGGSIAIADTEKPVPRGCATYDYEPEVGCLLALEPS